MENGMDDVSGANLLTRARKRKGLSQAAVAEQCEVTQPTVHNWETGSTHPHPDQWRRIAQVYGVAVRDLARHFWGAKAS